MAARVFTWARRGAYAGAAALCAGVVAAGVTACGTPGPRPVKPEVDLHHPSATRRLEAVSATEKARDVSEVPALIDRLEDDDGSVRMAAGAALVSLTGHDTGYRSYAPPEERRRQAAAWRAWWAAQSGAARPTSSGASSGGGGYTQGATHVGPP